MKLTNAVKSLFITIVVVMLIGQVGISPATAEETRCNQLQLLFLIDQSGSMNSVSTSRENDPNELRFAAPRTAVENLIDRHIRLYPDDEYQFSIVHFGTLPKLGLDWTPIQATTSEEGQIFMDSIADVFEQKTLGVASLGDTNFRAAFQYAASMFSKLDGNQPYSGGCPKRAIILLTDGKPEGDFASTGTADHMKNLQKELSESISIPPYSLYVVAMNDSSRDYWKEMAPHWEKIVGDQSRMGLVFDQEEVGKRFREILDELLGKGEVEDFCTGTRIIPPYLQWLSITYYKPGDASEHLIIKDEKNIPINPNRQDMRVALSGENTAIETMRIENPIPGAWNISTTAAEARCGLEQQKIFAIGKLVYPPQSKAVTRFSEVQIEFRLTDSQGGDLPDYQNKLYDMQVLADVQKAGASKSKGAQPLVAFEPGAKPNVYQGKFIPTETGIYEVTLEGSSKDIQGDVVEILPPGTSIGSFIVSEPQLVEIKKPIGLVVPQYKPIVYSLDIQDINQQSLTLASQFDVHMEVTHAGVAVPINTANDSAAYKNSFTFTPEKPGQYQVSYWCTVNHPGQPPLEFGRQEVTLEVYQTERLNVNFINPAEGEDNLVVTNYLNQPDKMRIEFQVMKANEGGMEEPISPDQIATGDAIKLFAVKVENEQGADVSKLFHISRTAVTGGYELVADKIPVGNYKVTVQPVQDIKGSYVWNQDAWIRQVRASTDMRFYYLLAGVGLILLLSFSCLFEFIRRFPHPASGTLYVYEMVTDSYTGEITPRIWMSENLHRNFHRYMFGIRWKLPCLMPKFYFYRMPPRIRRIDVRSLSATDSNEGRISVEAWGKSKKSHAKVRITSGGVSQPLVEGYLIAKDPPADWRD